ncbi:MAG: transglycosylase SLT domain-containing protein [Pseudanabaenaceae cyanobacterium bins.68]|nr:transglycosylase SLT domain-containing protein [Pseudanabaenaceae cyanobacterium bins.68]
MVKIQRLALGALVASMGLGAAGAILWAELPKPTTQVAKTPKQSVNLTTGRDRYRLALSQLNQSPAQAIATLANLEQEYPQLAPYIWLKRAEAYRLSGDRAQANQIYQRILAEYPQVAAEALSALGKNQQIIQQFPSHPLALPLILQALQKAPDRLDLLLAAAKYFHDQKSVVPLLDRLVAKHKAHLQPDHWWAIANGYFDHQQFAKAAQAYSQATPNSFTAYRRARSWHRADRSQPALQAYLAMAQAYPDAPEAPRALLRAIQVSEPEAGFNLVPQIVKRYPSHAAEALLAQYDLALKLQRNPQAIAQKLLSAYPKTAAAASLIWRNAQAQAEKGNFPQAIKLVQQIDPQINDSEVIPQAYYWAGKWAKADRPLAQKLFQTVLAHHNSSYYAWRSAVQLGWQVGDFHNVRNLNFNLQAPSQRQALPAGAELVQELYLLGQDRDAAWQWQQQTRGKLTLTLAEIFTDGVLRVGINDNIVGIYLLDSLNWLDVSASDRAQIKLLQQHPAYLQNLYPFAYGESINRWANQYQLNPALVTGLIRQESRFEVEIRSVVGATGLMQIMPETGSWIASKKGRTKYSLTNPTDNIEFGTFYLDYTHSRFQNNSLLAIASYNAGPNAVAGWVKSSLGDPDQFVQRIPYAETRGYVHHVFANYWNYLRLYSPQVQNQLQALSPTSKRSPS